MARVISNSCFPLNQEMSITNIENFSWESVLKQIDSLAPLLSNVLTSAVTNKANKASLTRGNSINLKPQLGTVIATLLHIKAPRKVSLLPTLFSIQIWRGGLKRETIKQLADTGVCVGYQKWLTTIDNISKEFDATEKRCKSLIEEQNKVLQNVEQPVEQDLELSNALAVTAPNIEDEDTILFSDDQYEDLQTEFGEEWQKDDEDDNCDDSDEDHTGNDTDESENEEKKDDADDVDSDDNNIDRSESVLGDTVLNSDENMDESLDLLQG